MLRRISRNLTLFLFTSDLLLTMLALRLAKILRLSLPYGLETTEQYLEFPFSIYIAAAVVWAVVFVIIPVYDPKRTYRAIDQLQLMAIAVGAATLVFAGLAYFFFRELSRVLFLYFFALDLLFLTGLRVFLRLAFRAITPNWPACETRVLILGAGKVGRRLALMLKEYSWYGVEVVGFLDDNPATAREVSAFAPYLGKLDEVGKLVETEDIDDVIFALPLRAHNRLVTLVQDLNAKSVQVRVVPDLFELIFTRASIDDFNGIPMVGLRDPAISPFQRAAKRGFDLLLGGVTLILVSPIMALVALAIKLDSPGSVFFDQERVGENGKRFMMCKFRSMEIDADKRRHEVISYTASGEVLHKKKDDPRVTRIGRFIRRTSLDELPQLINVIKGEMSLVGPRPEMPWLVDLYEPWQYKRFAVPQGITGWWQVNGRSDKPMHLHIEEDLYYIQNYSLLLDIQILWRTASAVMKRSGAY